MSNLIADIADSQGRLTMLQFIKQIDKMIESGVPSDHLWNFCSENRKQVIAAAEGRR